MIKIIMNLAGIIAAYTGSKASDWAAAVALGLMLAWFAAQGI
jgi:hypothetical protein